MGLPRIEGPRELGVGDVATLLGCDRGTARKWLEELEAKQGAQAVYRRSGRLYTTNLVMARFHPPASDRRMVAVVADLTERIRDLEVERAAAREREVTLQRQAREWFMGKSMAPAAAAPRPAAPPPRVRSFPDTQKKSAAGGGGKAEAARTMPSPIHDDSDDEATASSDRITGAAVIPIAR